MTKNTHTKPSGRIGIRRPSKRRKLTDAEERFLTETQKDYLAQNTNAFSLQPHVLARKALYQTRHGAVTINAAIELDAVHARYRATQAVAPQGLATPMADNYSMAEDNFIDRHGFSSALD